ncbi:MAG: fumarylacetoacetate hydrolase family protein [Acidobacteriota bacterium]
MRLFRLSPEGFFAVERDGDVRWLHSDPFEEPVAAWSTGRSLDLDHAVPLAPVLPGKVIGIGRNYAAHAAELGNAVPDEPLLFLKSPGAVIGPGSPVLLPPESERVDFEGEIGVVVRRTLRRADRAQARRAVLGVTAACDVTARDLQRRDATFARSKSFDTFCPLGPSIAVEPDLEALEIVTRVDGVERQRGHVRQMIVDILDLLVYASRMMTLEPGDVVLTGTPEGVGPLEAGSTLEVEVTGVGVLRNPIEHREDAG